MKSQHDFIVPSDQSFSELISSLQTAFNLHHQDEKVSYRIFYDTDDGLLYDNGAVLEMHEDGDSRKVYWRAGKDDQLRIQLGLRQVPRLASDLPECEFRKQLASIISVRELEPRITIKIKRKPVVIVNEEENAVVRMNLDENWFYPMNSCAGCLLNKRLTLKPVKGQEEAEQQADALMHKVDLQPAQDNMLKSALTELGSSTAEHSTKLNLTLNPEMTAEDALKKILLRLLDIMQRNTAGAIQGLDIEFMHDYRVSIRKTRSALALIKHVLPKDAIKTYKKFFAGLGQLTNPVRDNDVFLIKLDTYKKKLTKDKQEQLVPLQQYLIDNREEAQKRFIDGVKSSTYHQTLNEWRAFLEDHTALDPPLKNTNRPVFQLANQLIWGTYQTVLQEGHAITDTSPAEALHELRKTCKKLRYLIEFFQSLYPAGRVREVINALKGLQDNLGDYNDYHVHMLILEGFTEHSSDEAAVIACNEMIDGLRQKQQKTRNHFAERYLAFSSQNNQDEFRELFVDSSEGNDKG